MSLDLLQDFHNFCVKNGLHYSLSGGTLLGAIRHNGFIPWDDDIDVQMPRPDYDRFIHTYHSENGYKVYSRELSDFAQRKMTYCYARLCDMEKTVVDTGILSWIPEKVGLWIDILPCDGMPDSFEDAELHLKKINSLVLKAYWLGVRYSSWSNIYKGKSISKKIKFAVKKVLSVGIKENLFEKLLRLRKKYDFTESSHFFVTPHYKMGKWQPKKNMENFELHKFEDSEFYIMSGWDANLKSLYGDYMKLPPEDKRVTHDFNRYYWKD